MKSSHPSLTIVIPCYNEASNLPLLVSRLAEVLDRDCMEVILVDNGSTDSTSEVLSQMQAANSFIRTLRVDKNLGYGHGILAGLDAATSDVLAWTHADLQTDPSDILTAFHIYQKYGNDDVVVKGSRQTRPFPDNLITYGMRLIVAIVLFVRLGDINGQPKLFSRNFYKKHLKHNSPSDFSLDLFLLYSARRAGVKIIDIPVFFPERLHGEAKGGGGVLIVRLKSILRALGYILKLRLKW